MFTEDIQLSVTSDKTDERDRSIRNVVNGRQCKPWQWQDGDEAILLNQLERCFPFKAAVAMMSIVEELEVLGLGPEVTIASKPLCSKESPVIGVIKALHGSITPRFSYWDEDHLDPQQQTEFEDNAEGTGITIAPTKTELVVDLKKVGYPYGFPAADQALSHGLVVFSSLGVEKDSMAVEIHDIERIEASIVFDIPRSNEICLMDVVDPQGFCEIMVFYSFGDIRSFF